MGSERVPVLRLKLVTLFTARPLAPLRTPIAPNDVFASTLLLGPARIVRFDKIGDLHVE